jgi:hypothetical protein
VLVAVCHEFAKVYRELVLSHNELYCSWDQRSTCSMRFWRFLYYCLLGYIVLSTSKSDFATRKVKSQPKWFASSQVLQQTELLRSRFFTAPTNTAAIFLDIPFLKWVGKCRSPYKDRLTILSCQMWLLMVWVYNLLCKSFNHKVFCASPYVMYLQKCSFGVQLLHQFPWRLVLSTRAGRYCTTLA